MYIKENKQTDETSKKEKIQIVVECSLNKEEAALINKVGKIKCSLPCINAYVVEVNKNDLSKLKNIKSLKGFHSNTHITAQMNNARKTVNADSAQKNGLSGKNVTIAILDTGIAPLNDFIYPKNRIICFKDFINNKSEPYDDNGHGTHVAGIAAGNGTNSNGKYKGIAPEANLVILKILNREGKGNLIDVLTGIQWLLDNKEKYNIKAANLSIGTDNTSSNDPLVKAVEKAWDMGIAITIAAGNNGPASKSITSPGISRKAITVGTYDDDSEAFTLWGDNLINFSGRGPTHECIIKPDVVAPGSNIVSCLTPTPYDENKKINSTSEKSSYIRLSGTSMSTPIITGAIALLLEKHKNLNPNDIKLMLKKSCTDLEYPHNRQGWGLINVEKLTSQEVAYAKL